jgi:hypothetical protein
MQSRLGRGACEGRAGQQLRAARGKRAGASRIEQRSQCETQTEIGD